MQKTIPATRVPSKFSPATVVVAVSTTAATKSPRTRFNLLLLQDLLLGDYQITFIDGLWIALVVFEAVVILSVLSYRILQARHHKHKQARVRQLSFSMLTS